MKKNMRVLIADDHPRSRADLRAKLATLAFMEVIAEARKKPHTRYGEINMNKTPNFNADNNSQRDSIGSAVREILQESRKRHVVIRNRSGKKVIDCSVLLALILSIGAPVLPAFVILGVLVEAISISFEKT
jgi:hypothetical protein